MNPNPNPAHQTFITPHQAGAIIPAGPSLAEVEQAYRTHLAGTVAAGTIAGSTAATYQAGVHKFTSWAGESNMGQMSPDVIRQWVTDVRQDAKPGSVNTWLAGVRNFCGWAVDAGHLPYNPAAGIKGGKRRGSNKHKRDVLTDAEVRRLLAVIPTDTDAGIRDYALITLMLYTGARTIELHRADVADVRTDGERLQLAVQGKGRDEKDDVVIITHPDAIDAVHKWLAVRRPLAGKDGPLFVSLSNKSAGGRLSLSFIRRMVMDYMNAAGIVGAGSTKTVHSLRHTAITNAIRNGAPVTAVQAMARHANLATTGIYVHEVARQDNPAEAFIRYDGVR